MLNTQQQKIIDDSSDRLLVLAAAGVGKTTVLIEKIRTIITSKRYDPQRVLAITFSNKAANEMKQRLGTDTNVNIFTFHAFCARILRNYGDRIAICQHFQISDSPSVLKTIYGDHAYKYPYSVLERLRNLGYDIKDVVNPDDLEIYQKYRKHCQIKNIIDFQDLIIYVLSALQTDIEFRKFIQSKYDYILVDEFQDTNIAQLELIKHITNEKTKLLVVGDDCQAIHEWRGANVTNILYFKKHFPNSNQLLLEKNYRSQKNILEMANRLIRNNMLRMEKRLEFSKDNRTDNIFIKTVKNASQEAEYVAKQILENHQKQESIAILYRTNAQSRIFEDVLTKYNIKFHITGSYSFYKRKEIKDILAVIYVALDIDPDDSHYIRCLKNLPKIGPVTIKKIIEYSNKHRITVKRATSEFSYRGQKLIQEFNMFCMNLVVYKPIDAINKIIEHIQVDIKDIEISEHITSLNQVASQSTSLVDFIDQIMLDNSAMQQNGTEKVNLMTKAEYGEVYKQFDARTRKAEEELQKIFKSINAEQKKELSMSVAIQRLWLVMLKSWCTKRVMFAPWQAL